MSTKNQKTVKVAVKSIEFTRNGEMVIVAQPNDVNPKGSYIMNEKQEQRILQRAGVPDAIALKHLVALSNGTTVLEFVAQENKAGEAWDNGKEGAARKSGVFTKDWVQYSNHGITLGFAAQMKLTEMAIQASFANGHSIRGTVSARPVRANAAVATPVLENNAEFESEGADEVADNATEDPNV